MATTIIIITALLLAAGLIAAIMAVKSAGEHVPNTYERRTEEHKDEQKRHSAKLQNRHRSRSAGSYIQLVRH